MASETPQSESDDYALRLEHLHRDRQNLATRLGGQRWLGPGLGLVAAVVVAGPAVPDETWRSIVLVTALVASIALLFRYRRTTGIKLSRVGARAAVIYVAGLGVSLVLLSVSYGLAASGLSWWITASAVTAFVLVTWLVRLWVAAVGDHMSHGF